jgi:hypothetical protein
MGKHLLSYAWQRNQACRERADGCVDSDDRIQWLERSVEWAAIARELEFQRDTHSEIAALIPVPRKARLKSGM